MRQALTVWLVSVPCLAQACYVGPDSSWGAAGPLPADTDVGPGSGSGDASGGAGRDSAGASGGTTGDSSGSESEGEGDDAELDCTTPHPGPAPLRRLNHVEYDNTIADLLGDTSRPSSAFPADATAGFDNNAKALGVIPTLVDAYMLGAEAIALRATSQALAERLGCDPSGGAERSCVRSFLQSFGQKAWRRPLDVSELDRYEASFVALRATDDVATSVGMLISAMLQSPHFLYRVEVGEPAAAGEATRLTAFEMATRLSYFLRGSLPDEALFQAAARGELATREQVVAAARRLLDDPRARAVARRFYTQWLEVSQLPYLEKDGAAFPEFAAVRSLLRDEVAVFTERLTWGGGTLRDLYTAPYAYLPSGLLTHYGVVDSSPTGDADPPRVDFDPARRAGVLTMGGVLAVQAKAVESSPVRRGRLVRERVFCTSPPPPPDNVNVMSPDVDPNVSTRERSAQHSTDPACSGCHRLLDPIGLGFEHYDAVGRWRDLDGGKPVDASGEIFGTDVPGRFDGAVELAHRIADSESAAACFSRQWLRFALGRAEAKADDACSLEQLRAAVTGPDEPLTAFIVAAVQTDAFLYRPANGDLP